MGSVLKLNDAGKFAESFLDEFLGNGMGRLQKRDIDILVFHLLLRDHGKVDNLNFFQLSRQFKISETRLRNMHYEAQLRYETYSEKDAIEEFIDVVERGQFESSAQSSLVFIIRNPMLRQFFEEWVAANDGFTDSSFNKSLVKVSESLLVDILHGLVKDEKRVLELSSHFIDEKNPKEIKKVLSAYVKKFLCKKLEKGAEQGFKLAALFLKQMILT